MTYGDANCDDGRGDSSHSAGLAIIDSCAVAATTTIKKSHKLLKTELHDRRTDTFTEIIGAIMNTNNSSNSFQNLMLLVSETNDF